MKALALLAALAATAAHADWLPDAVELPVATRHLAHNDRLNNKTPGVVLHWDTPMVFAGTNAVRVHAAAFRNSNGDPTIYGGLHAEWHITGRLYAGFGVGLTYGYKAYDYGGNAWRDGVPFSVGNVSGRRFEQRKFRPALQLDARYQLTPAWSVTAHLVADEKLCRRTPADPAGLHNTSCAVWIGVRRAF